MAPAEAGAATGDLVVALGDRYEILARQRFEGIDRPLPDCFRARRTGQTQGDFLAIVTGLIPLARAEMLATIKSIDRPGLQSLLDWGAVDWGNGERRLALIFSRPPAPQIMASMDVVRPPMGEEELVRVLLAPAYQTLQEMHTRSLYHGAIRPTNIYYGSNGAGIAVLGECISAPPGFLQPVVCEPIERALAEPIGRGVGTSADDLYALGITAAILVIGQQPLRALPESAQIDLKIDRGSYAAVIGNARVPSGLIEPLRGMLADDPAQRWTIDDLGKWLGGRRQNPRQTTIGRRTQRPIQVNGVEIWNTRALATAMSRNVPEAAKMIDSGEIDRWLRRNLGDPDCAIRVAEAVAKTSTQGKGGNAYEERLVTRVCIAMDPAGPIRYRGRSVRPTGIGWALAHTVARGEPVQPLAELVMGQFALYWYASQVNAPQASASTLKNFENYKTVLERPGFGYGIERCLYEMLPAAPCMSDFVGRLYVNSPAALLQALETVAANTAKRPSTPLDRHIAGFVAARDRSIGEAMLNALSVSTTDGERQLALLNILTGIQRRGGPPALPKLAEWFLGAMQSIIERYRSRKTRKQLHKDVAAAAQQGDLAEIQRLVDDPQTIARDQAGFAQAQEIYRALADEVARLQLLADNRTKIEQTAGRETAAVVSAAAALLLAAGIVLLQLGA